MGSSSDTSGDGANTQTSSGAVDDATGRVETDATEAQSRARGPLREIVQPFIDLVHAPRALWGINLGYMIEGMVYFGILGYLTIYFSEFVFRGVHDADVYAHSMVMVLTGGITLAMVFEGFVADKWGVRVALIGALLFMLAGRVLISTAPTLLGLEPSGLWSALHWVTVCGILLVVIGYGMYQPAAYAGVRQFTTPKTAGIAFAMLYALMNLGGWFPTYAFLIRDDSFLGLGIPGTFWVYTGFTVLALLWTLIVLTRRTVEDAAARAKLESAASKEQDAKPEARDAATPAQSPSSGAEAAAAEATERLRIPSHIWGAWAVILVGVYFIPDFRGVPWRAILWALLVAAPTVLYLLPARWGEPAREWIARHPLCDGKFFFFIFALIPVQTLFTYNWLVLPPYIKRAYAGWIGEYYEIFSNQNALLIFILVPIIAALTEKRNVYNLMILGTFIMAAPAFLLVIGPSFWTLAGYIVLMTVGEAMWQPRFLQYVAEIAPEGRTGVYMGVGQLPWFLTKVLVPLLYSGKMMAHYCPAEGPKDTETMWLIFACIAMLSTPLLIVAKPWIGKDFKTKSD